LTYETLIKISNQWTKILGIYAGKGYYSSFQEALVCRKGTCELKVLRTKNVLVE